MKQIRLTIDVPFLRRYLTAGMVIGLPADLAEDLIKRELAEAVEPERAVIKPQETRIEQPSYRRKRQPQIPLGSQGSSGNQRKP